MSLLITRNGHLEDVYVDAGVILNLHRVLKNSKRDWGIYYNNSNNNNNNAFNLFSAFS